MCQKSYSSSISLPGYACISKNYNCFCLSQSIVFSPVHTILCFKSSCLYVKGKTICIMHSKHLLCFIFFARMAMLDVQHVRQKLSWKKNVNIIKKIYKYWEFGLQFRDASDLGRPTMGLNVNALAQRKQASEVTFNISLSIDCPKKKLTKRSFLPCSPCSTYIYFFAGRKQ